MTNRQLQTLRSKYFKEGYKIGLKNGNKKMLRESSLKGINASEIEEIFDAQVYDLSALKNYVKTLASKTDYNKIVYFTSEATINGQGKAIYGYTCNVDTDNEDLVIDRVGFHNKNSEKYITLSFNLSHPYGRNASDRYWRYGQLDMSKFTINDIIDLINKINEDFI